MLYFSKAKTFGCIPVNYTKKRKRKTQFWSFFKRQNVENITAQWFAGATVEKNSKVSKTFPLCIHGWAVEYILFWKKKTFKLQTWSPLTPFTTSLTMLLMWSCMRWVIGARTPCVSPPCNSHLLHTGTHTYTLIYTPTPLLVVTTSTTAPHDPSSSPELLQSSPTHQRISDWQTVKIHQHGLHLAQVPHHRRLRNLYPPPPLVPGENTLEPKCFRAGSFLGRKGFVSGHRALLRWRACVCVRLEVEVGWVGIAGCLEVRGFGEARWLRGSRGCLVLRGNISKARRKSCQINFSPFQSHPWEFLPHFPSAGLTRLFFWMELPL